jgi:hypothetical protein
MGSTRKIRLISARGTKHRCFRDSGDVPIENVAALTAGNEDSKSVSKVA